jgi:acyl-CoA synthetase (AMP-forming)/AMP-acid ligase II
VARNSLAHIAALYALLATRRTTVMIYSALPEAALASEIAKLALPAVIADSRDWTPLVLDAALVAGSYALDVTGALGNPVDVLNAGDISVGEWAGPVADIAVEMLSSGTTGLPKRIPIKWTTLEQMARDAIVNFAESGQGSDEFGPAPLIQPAPLANISGLYGVVPSGMEGRPLSLLPKFDVTAWVETVQRIRPRVSWLPPAGIQAIWDAGIEPAALSSLISIRTGSAPLDRDLQHRFEQKYDLKILLMYGFTESCGTIVMWNLADRALFGEAKYGAVGRPRPGVQLRVVEPATGKLSLQGEMGILEAQVRRMSNDWIRTSDLARIDADGFLYLNGRADDVINRGGFKVLPEMVAEAIQRHACVAAAVVLGLADARLGEVPIALVVLHPGATVSEQELAEFSRQTLTAYQTPTRFLVVDDLPRTQTMKIDRPAARRLLDAQLARSGA